MLVGDAAYKSYRIDAARDAYETALRLGHPEAERRLAKLTRFDD